MSHQELDLFRDMIQLAKRKLNLDLSQYRTYREMYAAYLSLFDLYQALKFPITRDDLRQVILVTWTDHRPLLQSNSNLTRVELAHVIGPITRVRRLSRAQCADLSRIQRAVRALGADLQYVIRVVRFERLLRLGVEVCSVGQEVRDSMQSLVADEAELHNQFAVMLGVFYTKVVAPLHCTLVQYRLSPGRDSDRRHIQATISALVSRVPELTVAGCASTNLTTVDRFLTAVHRKRTEVLGTETETHLTPLTTDAEVRRQLSVAQLDQLHIRLRTVRMAVCSVRTRVIALYRRYRQTDAQQTHTNT